ncbi:MAG: CoA-binding protein [Ignavibacteriales bacterium]|nr:CoA-binding protein [Ignavibacteriales bacterium]
MPIEDAVTIETILRTSKTIALVGASEDPSRDSHRIMRFLLDRGYTVHPVNPRYDTVLGKRCFPNLEAVPESIDIVDVFRRLEAVPEIVDEAIGVKAKVLWLQFGVIHEEAAAKAEEHGIRVIMDRCIAVEHSRLM